MDKLWVHWAVCVIKTYCTVKKQHWCMTYKKNKHKAGDQRGACFVLCVNLGVCVRVCSYLRRATMVNSTNPTEHIMATKLSIEQATAPPLTAVITHTNPHAHSLPSTLITKSLVISFFKTFLLLFLWLLLYYSSIR